MSLMFFKTSSFGTIQLQSGLKDWGIRSMT